MADETAPDHIPYKITSQEKTQQLTPDGRFVDVWRIGYEGPNGYHSFVTIPVSEFEPAHVDSVIEAELDTIMSVHNLGPEPHPENLAE